MGTPRGFLWLIALCWVRSLSSLASSFCGDGSRQGTLAEVFRVRLSELDEMIGAALKQGIWALKDYGHTSLGGRVSRFQAYPFRNGYCPYLASALRMPQVCKPHVFVSRSVSIRRMWSSLERISYLMYYLHEGRDERS